jgi:hypothetical protein
VPDGSCAVLGFGAGRGRRPPHRHSGLVPAGVRPARPWCPTARVPCCVSARAGGVGTLAWCLLGRAALAPCLSACAVCLGERVSLPGAIARWPGTCWGERRRGFECKSLLSARPRRGHGRRGAAGRRGEALARGPRGDRAAAGRPAGRGGARRPLDDDGAPGPAPRRRRRRRSNAFAYGTAGGRANPFIGAGAFALAGVDGATAGDTSFEMFFFHCESSETRGYTRLCMPVRVCAHARARVCVCVCVCVCARARAHARACACVCVWAVGGWVRVRARREIRPPEPGGGRRVDD